jgi:hypothetical protein
MPKVAAPIDVITLEDTEECALNLLEAARMLGFVYITLQGTNITTENVAEMFKIVCVSNLNWDAVLTPRRHKNSLPPPSPRGQAASSLPTTKAGVVCSRKPSTQLTKSAATSNSTASLHLHKLITNTSQSHELW